MLSEGVKLEDGIPRSCCRWDLELTLEEASMEFGITVAVGAVEVDFLADRDVLIWRAGRWLDLGYMGGEWQLSEEGDVKPSRVDAAAEEGVGLSDCGEFF